MSVVSQSFVEFSKRQQQQDGVGGGEMVVLGDAEMFIFNVDGFLNVSINNLTTNVTSGLNTRIKRYEKLPRGSLE